MKMREDFVTLTDTITDKHRNEIVNYSMQVQRISNTNMARFVFECNGERIKGTSGLPETFYFPPTSQCDHPLRVAIKNMKEAF